MGADFEELKLLEARISDAEVKGDIQFIEELLAPAFGFRSAAGGIVDRSSFIATFAPSSQRKSELLAIDLLSRNRAVVSSMVTVDSADGSTLQRFHNVRLFVRGTKDRDRWMLLGWAKELVPNSGWSPQPAGVGDQFFGRELEHDLELWKHHASIGGEDKSRMVTVSSWLLGFSAAILWYLATQIFFRNIEYRGWLQAAVVSALGACISFAAAYIAVLYGGYANRNWKEADDIAWRRGWLDLLPTENSVGVGLSEVTHGKSIDAGQHKRLDVMWRPLNAFAWRLARPAKPTRYLAPVFHVFFIFAVLAFAVDTFVALLSVLMALSMLL